MPVVLLCHADGINGQTTFLDAVGGHTLAATNATVSTTNPKFGTGSANFAVASARIDTGNATDFNFGAGQFTIECWAYWTSFPANDRLLAQWGTGSNNGWALTIAGSLAFYWSTTGSDFPNIFTSNPTQNAWHHVAVDRDASNVLRLYLDGAVANSQTVGIDVLCLAAELYNRQ